MKKRNPLPRLFAVTWLLVMASAASLAEPDESELGPTASVTVEILEAKVAETEAASGLEEAAKDKLLELYRRALDNLQTAAANAQTAEEYSQIQEVAPVRIKGLREALHDLENRNPADIPDEAFSEPLPQLESRLQKAKTELASFRSQRSDAENSLVTETARPPMIRQRLKLAQERHEKLAIELGVPPAGDEDPATAQAREWELESEFQKHNSEIAMLDQELLSLPVRRDVLSVERETALANEEWADKRVNILEDLVDRKRREEADLTLAEAEATREDAEGKHPMVVRLAEQNALLSAEIADTVSVLGDLTDRAEEAAKQASRIEGDFNRAQETIEIGGLSQELGHMLSQQRYSLPSLRNFRREAKERREVAAKIGVRRLGHRQEESRLRDADAYIASLPTADATEITTQLDNEIGALLEDRRDLLEKAIDSDDLYLRKLGELESAQQRLFDQVKGFDEFMDVHLLWVRSGSPAELEELGALPEQVWRILSPSGWLEVAQSLRYQAARSPVFALLVLVLAALSWSHKRIVAAIQELGTSVGRPKSDRFSNSVQAFVLTLIAGAALPLLMVVTGWQLKISGEGTSFSIAVGGALIVVSTQVFFLRAFRLICIEKGLAEAHFRWPDSRLQLLRRELDRLTWIYLPAAIVCTVAIYLDPLNAGWAVGRIAFLVLAGSLSFAFYRLLHPENGIFAVSGKPGKGRAGHRWRWLWYSAVVAAPLVLGIVAILGYLRTAGTLLAMLVATSWLLVAVWLLWALARRSLLIARRRLAYEASVEERMARWAARKEQGEGEEHTPGQAALLEVEEPEVDLVALSETSAKLLNTVFVFMGIVGLWMVWSEVFPALRILDGVTLWQRTEMVGGEERITSVTLAEIGMAMIYAIVTVVLMKQLPAVLEIILLHSTDMTAPGRYSITTLANYLIVIAGVVLVSVTIGVDWSKLQWLIAALGVGIGFGLQEIVANFISGLIILFERPIRVGDVVTVGETDGVVTKIRIRATTIRNWDRKELLVPNKEFITARVLNWSLSDQVTRVMIVVGVAYEADVDMAHELMIEAAKENEYVIAEPGPIVSFEAFGDNSLTLLLRAYIDNMDHRLDTITTLHKSINRKFKEAGISIAFPQRDLHLNTVAPLQVSIVESSRNQPRSVE